MKVINSMKRFSEDDIEEIVDISAVKTNTIESKEEGTEKTVKPGDKFKYQIRKM